MNRDPVEVLISVAREAGDKARTIQHSGRFDITNKEGAFGTHFLTEADTAEEMAEQILPLTTQWLQVRSR